MNYSARIHLVKQKQKLSKKPILFADNVALNYVGNFRETTCLQHPDSIGVEIFERNLNSTFSCTC